MVTITIAMKPIGKGRPRFGNGRTYTPAKTVAAEKRIADEWKLWGGDRITGPVSLFVEAYYQPPKSWRKAERDCVAEVPIWKETAPDLDNIIKLVKDALNGLAYDDDKQVVDIAAAKLWADKDELIITVDEAWR